MLGGGILLVVLVLVFSIRACAGSKKGKKGDSETTTEQTVQETGTENVSTTSQDTAEKEGGSLETANAEVTQLITDYYNALAAADIDKLREITVNFTPGDEAKVKSDAQVIDSYLISGIYTKNGLTDGSYVAYTSYDIIYNGYNTSVPMLAQFYIVPDNGRLKLESGATSDPDVATYISRLDADADVQNLRKNIQAAYDAALRDDQALTDFLSGLGDTVTEPVTGEATTTAAEENKPQGPTVTTNTDSNLRDNPGGESEVLTVVPEGSSVEMIEEDGLWVKVRYNGQEGYIYSELIDQ